MRSFGVRRLDAAFKLSGALKESDSVAKQSAVKPWSPTAPPEAGKPAHSKDASRQIKVPAKPPNSFSTGSR